MHWLRLILFSISVLILTAVVINQLEYFNERRRAHTLQWVEYFNLTAAFAGWVSLIIYGFSN